MMVENGTNKQKIIIKKGRKEEKYTDGKEYEEEKNINI